MENIYQTTLKVIMILVAYCSVVVSAYETRHTKTCIAGMFLKLSEDGGICLPCQLQTFMPLKNHTQKKCYVCTQLEDQTLEIIITPCDKFRDADIQCVEGYYRLQATSPYHTSSCVKCRPACPEGLVQVHRCQNFTDLGCCPGENYDFAVQENGIPYCRERPVMCRKGQFRDTQLNDCKPCPSETFIDVDFHSHTKCWDCQHKSEADLPLNAIITVNCTTTQQSQYGCKDGFFYLNNSLHGVRCSPCQTCDKGKYVGRQCDMNHDTVCCDKPNMTVEDGPQGGLCVDEIPLSSSSERPYHRQTTKTTTVTKPSVPATTTVTGSKSTESQTSPHEYIILGIFVLFTIAAITFCIFKLRKILWKYCCIPIQNITSRNSERRYVNVNIALRPAPAPSPNNTTEEHIYESVY